MFYLDNYIDPDPCQANMEVTGDFASSSKPFQSLMHSIKVAIRRLRKKFKIKDCAQPQILNFLQSRQGLRFGSFTDILKPGIHQNRCTRKKP